MAVIDYYFYFNTLETTTSMKVVLPEYPQNNTTLGKLFCTWVNILPPVRQMERNVKQEIIPEDLLTDLAIEPIII